MILFLMPLENLQNQCKEALTLNGRFVSVKGQGIAKVQTEDLLFLKSSWKKAGSNQSLIDATL